MLKTGDKAPAFSLLDQNNNMTTLTPGCTQQSCLLRDIRSQIGKTIIIGISPDEPAKQLKFDKKYDLGFKLLADTEHLAAKAFKVWKKKSMYGREYMGIERSAFLIDGTGKIINAWYKISPKDTPTNLLGALA